MIAYLSIILSKTSIRNSLLNSLSIFNLGKAVLVLGAKHDDYLNRKQATIIGFDGQHEFEFKKNNLILGQIEEINFSFEYNTDVAGACSVIYSGNALLIGGSKNKRQVKKKNPI